MELFHLLKNAAPLKVCGDATFNVTGLYYDSRRVEPGGVFFALRGAAADGHLFIEAAVRRGASAVVLEDESAAPAGVTWVAVQDARLALSRMAAAFYGDPTAGMTVVGVTGTNGKTTTTYLVEAMLRKAGVPAAVLGTVSYRFGDTVIPAPHTTPESEDLQRILRQVADEGAQGVVMEVSSHALEQRRVDGCRFDVGIFTNLTPEHLDYHGDMESYLGSKARLFSELLAPDAEKPRRGAAVNVDDPYGPRVARAAACPVVTYGLGGGAMVTARDYSISTEGIRGILVTPNGEKDFHSPMLGRFNLYNILGAAAAGVALDLSLGAIRHGIEAHHRVPGRMERVENGRGVTVLVDYAHTGDALENVLKTVSEIATGRIITVFGCGGDRDRTKRPVMGAIAGRYSDLSIVTSDNPRTENPAAILAEVRGGLLPLGLREYQPQQAADSSDKGFTVLESRREAIRLAARAARAGDIVLIAGKGHEDYQIIGTERLHFDDREEAAAAFSELDGAHVQH